MTFYQWERLFRVEFYERMARFDEFLSGEVPVVACFKALAGTKKGHEIPVRPHSVSAEIRVGQILKARRTFCYTSLRKSLSRKAYTHRHIST
jgi:hypothetical protein